MKSNKPNRNKHKSGGLPEREGGRLTQNQRTDISIS
jgi:hypothetical protein